MFSSNNNNTRSVGRKRGTPFRHVCQLIHKRGGGSGGRGRGGDGSVKIAVGMMSKLPIIVTACGSEVALWDTNPLSSRNGKPGKPTKARTKNLAEFFGTQSEIHSLHVVGPKIFVGITGMLANVQGTLKVPVGYIQMLDLNPSLNKGQTFAVNPANIPYCHTTNITTIHSLASQGLIISGDRNGTIRLWKFANGLFGHVGVLFGHARTITEMACVGNLLYSASDDQCINLWQLAEGKGHMQMIHSTRKQSGVNLHGATVNCLINYDCRKDRQRYVISGSFDKTIKLWNASNMICAKSVDARTVVVSMRVVCGADNNDVLICGARDGALICYALPDLAFRGIQKKPNGRSFSKGSRNILTDLQMLSNFVVSASNDGKISLHQFTMPTSR